MILGTDSMSRGFERVRNRIFQTSVRTFSSQSTPEGTRSEYSLRVCATYATAL